MTNILDINQDQFVDQVIEKSKSVPVLVDFWAPWCGPCKQLTPTLENLVNKKNGKVILVKINVDENQGIAAQLNIQSIPTVYGFVDGKPIDAFQGAQPESKIDTMINKLIEATPGNEVPKLLEEANKLLKEQKIEESIILFEKLVSLDPGNPKVISGLLRCLIQQKKYDDAREMLDSLDENIIKDEEINKITKILSSLNSEHSEVLEELKSILEKNPKNHEKRYELAIKYFSSNETAMGFDELLYIYENDPKWNEDAAKKKLLEYFDLLGFNDSNVLHARKKLSSLMFK